MNILSALPGFVLAFILIFYYEYRIKLIKTKPKNNVHFYVARNKNGPLWLYLGKPIRIAYIFVKGHGSKPIRFKDDAWLPNKHGTVINTESSFEMIGLNKKDYDNLKWEDEPIEVFVNMED